MATKKKRGRPAGSGRGLTARLELRLSPDDKARIEESAADAGVDAAEWVRRAVTYCWAAKVPLRHATVS